MKTSLEIPDELVREVKILAARENLKLKDIIGRALRRTLDEHSLGNRVSIRNIRPVDLGRILPESQEADTFGDMLDDRGHRY